MARLKNLTERGHETQRHLRDVLVQLVLEKGYEAISIKDITERAEVDRSTFYLHFSDKHDLFTKSYQQLVDDLFAHTQQATGAFPGLTVLFEHMAQHADLYRVLLHMDISLPHAQRLNEYITQNMLTVLEQRLQQFNKTLSATDKAMVVSYVTSSLRGTARWWLEAGQPYSAPAITERFAKLITQGIAGLVLS